jgi:hypothetical protein
MPVQTADELLEFLPTPMQTKEGTATNWRFLQAIHEAIYVEWAAAFVDMVVQRAVGTATGTYLDAHRDWYNLPLVPGENDETKRIRIGLKRARLWGGVTYDTLLRLCSGITGVDADDIVVYESADADTGDYAPMRITYALDASLLVAAGVPSDDIAELLDQLSVELSAAAGAGTQVIVRLIGGGVYDSGDSYDGGVLYGSS